MIYIPETEQKVVLSQLETACKVSFYMTFMVWPATDVRNIVKLTENVIALPKNSAT